MAWISLLLWEVSSLRQLLADPNAYILSFFVLRYRAALMGLVQ